MFVPNYSPFDSDSYQKISSQSSISSKLENRQTRHLLSFFLNITLWGLFMIFGFCLLLSTAFDSPFFEDEFLTLFLWGLGLIYFVYVLELFWSNTFQTLFYAKSISKLEKYISFIKNTNPEFIYSCTPFHYEDKMDKKFTKEIKKEFEDLFFKRVFNFQKILGITKNDSFKNCDFQDNSDFLKKSINKSVYTEFTFEYILKFENNKIEKTFLEFGQKFKSESLSEKAFIDFSEKKRIRGFVKRIAILNKENKHWSTHWSIFIVISVLLVASWPYRLWIDDKIQKKHFVFRKIICEKKDEEIPE